MSMETSSGLSCEQAAILLDSGVRAAADPALAEHLAQCAECRALARILEVSASLRAEVPAGMTESVMRCIRTERTKQASRLAWMRRVGAIAAAAVLVPVAVIMAPILFGANDTAAGAERTATEADRVVGDTVPETLSSIAADTAAAAPTEAGVSETTGERVLMKSPQPAVSGTNETAETAVGLPPVGPAPSYVTTAAETKPQSTYSTMAADGNTKIPSVHMVLAALIGMDAAAPAADGNAAAAAALCREYEITRELFREAAEALDVVFTEEELDAIFG